MQYILSQLLYAKIVALQQAHLMLPIKSKYGRTVADVVIAVAVWFIVTVGYAVATGELLQLLLRAGQADHARVKCGGVLLQLLWRVAIRVDADKQNQRALLHRIRQSAHGRGQLGQCGGTDVRTISETEIHQHRVAGVICGCHLLAVFVGELESQLRHQSADVLAVPVQLGCAACQCSHQH